MVLQRPAGIEEWDVYPLNWEALSDRYDGPWTFTIMVKP